MAAKLRGLEETGAAGDSNQLLSFWKDQHNVGVLSSTDKEFVTRVRRWAKRRGYRVEGEGYSVADGVGREKEES